MDFMNVSFVIPAYNAESTIREVIEELRSVIGPEPEIIVVNDGSSDGTSKAIKDLEKQRIRVLQHTRNRGYGAALKTGIRAASGEIVVTLDSDGQHDPNELPKFFQEIGECDMVAGARQSLIHSALWRMPGKWVIGWLANFLSGTKIPDLNCGMRAFKRDVVKRYLHLCPDGFSISTTLTLALFNRGYLVKFVRVNVRKRQGDSPSKVNVRTGLETALLVLRLMTLFSPLRVFLPISFGCFAIGFLWALPFLWERRGLSISAMLLILTSVLLFFFGLLADQIAEMRKEKYE
jgi:glycosyltransferase involved in cell wall biosynthesis